MPTPFSSEDLSRLFDGRTITRGRTFLLMAGVEVALEGDAIVARVDDKGVRRTARLTPLATGNRVVFERRCTCRQSACPHLAAAGLAALERFPALRRAEQKSFVDGLSGEPADERQKLLISLEPDCHPIRASSRCSSQAPGPASSRR